jgi:hypothetical protein
VIPSTLRILSFCLLLGLILCGCRAEQEAPPWIPVLEPTSFSYLGRSSDQGLEEVRAALKALDAADRPATEAALRKIRHSFLQLRHYFIPMTEVRQLIYDAERLYALKRTDTARDHLVRAQKILAETAASGGTVMEKNCEEVDVMLQQLLSAMERSAADVGDRFHALGNRVNLLLVKGDLILAGIEFREER